MTADPTMPPDPWLQVPLADYEAHMALPSVARSQLLASTLHRVVTRFQPRSLALLGAAGGNGLELVDSAIVPVECIFAGLVLEYLRLDAFCSYLPSLLADGGIFATVLQLPADGLPEVSASPFPSPTQLQPAFSFVRPAHLHDLLAGRGFVRLTEELHELDTGKSFCFAAYQLTKPPDQRP